MKYQMENCIGARLRGLSRQVDAIYRKHLNGTGITENQLSILMALYKTGEIEQIEISRILNLERSSLSRNLVRLSEQQFIQKRGAVNRPYIQLSPLGVKTVEALLPLWEKAMKEVHQLIGKSAITAFSDFERGFHS